MIVTEKEAGDKWCPMISLRSDNRDIQFPCIGSRCMAWQPERIDSLKGFCGMAQIVQVLPRLT